MIKHGRASPYHDDSQRTLAASSKNLSMCTALGDDPKRVMRARSKGCGATENRRTDCSSSSSTRGTTVGSDAATSRRRSADE